jgi:Ca2+-transporting ATPase
MVLVDDSFGTIVRGIQEGRCIYANIQAFINFLISCNIGEVFAVFLATLFGFPSILSAIQLLWVNLITDGPPAIALGWNPPDETAMQKPPRTRNEDIVTAWVLTRYLVIGLYIGTATVGIFTAHFLSSGIDFDLLSKWTECREYASSTSICDAFSQDALAVPQTLALTTLIVTEMLKALSSVSVDASLLTIGPQRNPALLVGVFIPFSIHLGILYSSNFGFPAIADSFGLVPLSVDQWKSVLLWSLPILPLEEILKAFSRKQLSP